MPNKNTNKYFFQQCLASFFTLIYLQQLSACGFQRYKKATWWWPAYLYWYPYTKAVNCDGTSKKSLNVIYTVQCSVHIAAQVKCPSGLTKLVLKAYSNTNWYLITLFYYCIHYFPIVLFYFTLLEVGHCYSSLTLKIANHKEVTNSWHWGFFLFFCLWMEGSEPYKYLRILMAQKLTGPTDPAPEHW